MDNDSRLEHVAIAVPDLDAAATIFSQLLGRREVGRELVESEGVRIAFFDLEGVRLELMEPTDADSPIGRFLQRRGAGLHHIALEVPDIAAALERCRSAGLEIVGAAPRPGAGGRLVAFLHPRSTAGVLVELSQAAS